MEFSHYTADSRSTLAGSCFVALKGERSDGHDFLADARGRGAVAAIVRKDYAGPSFGLELIEVDNPLATLQELAREKLSRFPRVKKIAITGSVGKTTTKEFLAALLKGHFRLAKTPGNANTQISVPLTILNDFHGDEELLIIEMGMTGKGHIKRLTEIVPPDIAILTTVGYAHSAFFNSLEEIAEAKAEILTPTASVRFVGAELLSFPSIAKESVSPVSAEGCCFSFGGESWHFKKLPFNQKHLLSNLAFAIAVAKHLGLTQDAVEERILTLEPVEGRGTEVVKRGITFINDAYNASPLSVKAALENFGEGERRIAVLGAMKELGIFSKALHLEVAETALRSVDLLFLLGEETAPIAEFFAKKGRIAYSFKTRDEMVAHLRRELQEGDRVLVKGSNSLQLWKVIEEI